MSIEAQASVWAHSQASGSALLALLAIADHEGDGGAWPSMDTIAHRARVTRDAARKLVRKLEDMGEVRTETNGGGGLRTANHMRTNRYEITVECPPDCDRSARHRTRPQPVDNTPQPNGGGPATRLGAPQPHGGANHPLTTPIGNSLPRSEVLETFDRDSESPTDQSEYADWNPAEQLTKARRKMIEAKQQDAPRSRFATPPAPYVPRYDRTAEPPAPPPRSPGDDAAVATLMRTGCPARGPQLGHMIPVTSTICLHCAADARTTNRQETTP